MQVFKDNGVPEEIVALLRQGLSDSYENRPDPDAFFEALTKAKISLTKTKDL